MGHLGINVQLTVHFLGIIPADWDFDDGCSNLSIQIGTRTADAAMALVLNSSLVTGGRSLRVISLSFFVVVRASHSIMFSSLSLQCNCFYYPLSRLPSNKLHVLGYLGTISPDSSLTPSARPLSMSCSAKQLAAPRHIAVRHYLVAIY